MPEDIRIWEILDGDNLKEINRAKLDQEGRLENWLEEDISTISNDLLVIGRQVGTDFGGWIDLLCIDQNGHLIVVELKRDKTPREITAQTLDYASWVKDLSHDRISELADSYFRGKDETTLTNLGDAFKAKFKVELPDKLNERHKMLIVASEIDASTERIIKYLSENYGVAINAVTFQYFQHERKEFLARVFLIDPSQVEYSARTKTASTRSRNLTYEELQGIANENDVGELYRRLVEELTTHFDQTGTTRSTIAFIRTSEEGRRVVFSLLPGESSAIKGVQFQAYRDRFLEHLGATRDDVIRLLPSETKETQLWKDSPMMWVGFFKNDAEIDRFIAGLNEFKIKTSRT